uniref:Transposase n=1 Tax=Enterobius vermicularis TaxID=51028 RepID=A0A0N4VIS9_ENTVE
LQKRLQSSCDELSEKNNEYISAQNHAPEVASREEEVYQQYTQKDEGLLQVMVKTTDAIDKIWCLIEKAQRKEKLPKSTLPTFNGDSLSWEAFWESFSASVDCKDLPPTQRFSYSKGCLRNGALSVIEELPLSNANHKVAKKLLRARFGDRDVMRQLIYNQFGISPRCSGNTAQLRDFATEAKKY